MGKMRRTAVTSLLAGLAIGIGIPLVELWLACRHPTVPRSEACVWGHAYLPLSLGVGTIGGLVLGVIILAVRRSFRR